VSVARTNSVLRTSSLIALGAIAVHQLRYLAGYGDGAGTALTNQGHSYLGTVLPLLLVLAFSAMLGTFAVAAFRRQPGLAARGAGWAFCTAALVAIFTAQESAEGLLSAGHPGGLAALLGHGGWIAFPIAAAVGRIVASLLDGLASIERLLAHGSRRRMSRTIPKPGRPRAAARRSLACRTLEFGLARRPPPPLAW
jgi:hypothetical protein